ncbi:MAG: hypothetical protein DVB29_03215 [Verrucomicrobia bacterium]|jgi:hypothetical protein|nr:MAG: hypothetical protein DVB29_03215 [Verrucomicrobiota bacterium]MDH4470769.1 hypothetical protein [Verrucomicrobiae bacterium]
MSSEHASSPCCGSNDRNSKCCSSISSGLEKTATLDAFVHDKNDDLLILAMFESRPWNLGEIQLFQLQEKLNAYLSFVLDGEMEETFPHLKEKPVRIELRTLHEPSEEALGFIERAHHQLSHQQIDLQVVLIEEQFDASSCSQGCSCSESNEEQTSLNC